MGASHGQPEPESSAAERVTGHRLEPQGPLHLAARENYGPTPSSKGPSERPSQGRTSLPCPPEPMAVRRVGDQKAPGRGRRQRFQRRQSDLEVIGQSSPPGGSQGEIQGHRVPVRGEDRGRRAGADSFLARRTLALPGGRVERGKSFESKPPCPAGGSLEGEKAGLDGQGPRAAHGVQERFSALPARPQEESRGEVLANRCWPRLLPVAPTVEMLSGGVDAHGDSAPVHSHVQVQRRRCGILTPHGKAATQCGPGHRLDASFVMETRPVLRDADAKGRTVGNPASPVHGPEALLELSEGTRLKSGCPYQNAARHPAPEVRPVDMAPLSRKGSAPGNLIDGRDLQLSEFPRYEILEARGGHGKGFQRFGGYRRGAGRHRPFLSRFRRTTARGPACRAAPSLPAPHP